MQPVTPLFDTFSTRDGKAAGKPLSIKRKLAFPNAIESAKLSLSMPRKLDASAGGGLLEKLLGIRFGRHSPRWFATGRQQQLVPDLGRTWTRTWGGGAAIGLGRQAGEIDDGSGSLILGVNQILPSRPSGAVPPGLRRESFSALMGGCFQPSGISGVAWHHFASRPSMDLSYCVQELAVSYQHLSGLRNIGA